MFDFYGVRFSIAGLASPEVTRALGAFEYFEVSATSLKPAAEIQIELVPELNQRWLKLFEFRGAKAFGLSDRLVNYPNGPRVRIFRADKKLFVKIAEFHSASTEEVLILLIHSLVIWELQKKNWICLHAASFVDKGVAVVFCADSGSGKSVRTARAIQEGKKVFSDEITLISPGGYLHPWPAPLQLSQEAIELLQLQSLNLRRVEKRTWSAKYQWPLLRTQVSPTLPFREIETPYRRLGLAWRIMMGYGLPQILEFNLRFDSLTEILSILFKRANFVTSILWHGQKKLSYSHPYRQ